MFLQVLEQGKQGLLWHEKYWNLVSSMTITHAVARSTSVVYTVFAALASATFYT